jgi:hypothetical protein
MCVHVKGVGHKIQPSHCDLQCSIVLPLWINTLLILHFEWNGGDIKVTWFHEQLIQVTIS